jgi:hypothetical protein
MDISNKMNMLRFYREATPAIASVPSAPQKKMECAVESVQSAKRNEFPVAPEQKKKSKK